MTNRNKKKWISDVITIEEIEKWKQGDVITVSAGTGAGKSHFIKYSLHDYAVRNEMNILLLAHRKNCTDQFILEMEETIGKNIVIKTYQSVESLDAIKRSLDLEKYNIIVSDEFHYFMSDSLFNPYTDISLEAILSKNNAIRIFMSATGDDMLNYLKSEKHKNLSTIDYKLPISYKHIKSLNMYLHDSMYDVMIDDFIKNGHKAIFFVQSAEQAYNLYKKYKDISTFNCSRSNKLYKHVNTEEIENILKNQRFEKQFLFTTQTFDAGINVKDDELRHIVADIDDLGSLLQCIGRKRIMNEEDYIHLYIKDIPNQRLGGMYKRALDQLAMPLELFKNGDKAMIEKFYRAQRKSDMIYDHIDENGNVTKKLNELMFFKTASDIKLFQKMMGMKYGYKHYLSILFGVRYKVMETEVKAMRLEEYLESIVDKRLYKEEQRELIEKIDVRVDGRQQKSYRKLNQGIEMLGLNYVILPKKSNGKRYWEVHKVD